jgi:RNA polymerase-binding transcription factor DksA
MPNLNDPFGGSKLPREENLVRYSDEKLLMFKNLIIEKLKVENAEYQHLKIAAGYNSGEPSDNGDRGKSSQDKEEATVLAQRKLRLIQDLEVALTRTENKTYGICRKTKRLIPEERLKLTLHATLCAEAKNENPVH